MPRKESIGEPEPGEFSLSTLRRVNACLRQIRKRSGKLTPELVVREAESPRSPLHRFFEWNDAAAAKKHRLDQAMHLIRRVKVNVEMADGTKAPIRVWLNVQRGGERQYLPAVEVMRDADLARQVLADLKAECESVVRRYKQYDYCRKTVAALERAARTVEAEGRGRA